MASAKAKPAAQEPADEAMRDPQDEAVRLHLLGAPERYREAAQHIELAYQLLASRVGDGCGETTRGYGMAVRSQLDHVRKMVGILTAQARLDVKASRAAAKAERAEKAAKG